MSLVVIFGPQAVGKMTVGQELCKLTGHKLFYNHMAIDMIGQIFDSEHCGQIWQLDYTHYNLISTIWESVLEFGATNNEDLVFTLTWDMGNKNIENYMLGLEKKYNRSGSEVYFIELECDTKERLKRNETENRLKHKICKRDKETSNRELLFESDNFRLNSRDNELKLKNYMRINNSNKSVEETAKQIKMFMGV